MKCLQETLLQWLLRQRQAVANGMQTPAESSDMKKRGIAV
jgi:hypothetical protein